MSLAQQRALRDLHPQVRAAAENAIAWADYFDVPVVATSGFRSCERQAELRRDWELGLSRWPANRPGDSSHNYGLAFDSTTVPSKEADWWAIRSWIGFHVPTGDRIHAEVPGWRRLLLRRSCGFVG